MTALLPLIIAATILQPSQGPKAVGAQAQAWTNTNIAHIIFVNVNTDTFKQLRKGSEKAAVQMMAILAHEQYHLDHVGAPHALAYARQLEVLRTHGADSKTIREIEHSANLIAGN